jgi:hypothetical protein
MKVARGEAAFEGACLVRAAERRLERPFDLIL